MAIYLDFEFNGTTHEKLNLVCCCLMDKNHKGETRKSFWLHNNSEEQAELKKYIEENKGAVFVAYNAVAEARSILSLDYDPVNLDWIDLYLEQRCLTNHNAKLLYNRKQLVDGKIKYIPKPKPKYERAEGEGAGFRPTCSLAEATYALTGQIRDTKHKDEIRDIIISADEDMIEANKQAILDYCMEDVIFLPEIQLAQEAEYERLLGDNFCIHELEAEQFLRGEYAALTAHMESLGYPIDYEALKHFTSKIDTILFQCQREINELFPDVKPFKWKPRENKYSWNQIATKQWVFDNMSEDQVSRWQITDSAKQEKKKLKAAFELQPKHLSLSLEAWTRFFNYQHDYPTDIFGAQIVRYLKLKQSLNGFAVKEDKKNFWDYVGPDKRVRPYMNIYGSQSSRSQPAATGFMFLKPAWVRTLVRPPKGKAICGIDYGSQEFLVSALLSKDQNMIDAYKSGDVYMFFGKKAGIIPPDGTKKKNKEERSVAKGVVLGLSYLMSKFGLSGHLSNSTGKKWSEDEAQEFIDSFYEVFEGLKEYQDELQEIYFEDEEPTKLPCGWYMWCDNDNFRSVCNVPIQGISASIMRRAVRNAYEKGLKVIFTLHDALYIEYDENDFSAIDKLREAMFDAFIYYFEDKEAASAIRMDADAWSDSYATDSETITPNGMKVATSDKYVDERAGKEYQRFKKYFTPDEDDLL